MRKAGEAHDLVPQLDPLRGAQPCQRGAVERARTAIEIEAPGEAGDVGGGGQPERGVDALGRRAKTDPIDAAVPLAPIFMAKKKAMI